MRCDLKTTMRSAAFESSLFPLHVLWLNIKFCLYKSIIIFTYHCSVSVPEVFFIFRVCTWGRDRERLHWTSKVWIWINILSFLIFIQCRETSLLGLLTIQTTHKLFFLFVYFLIFISHQGNLLPHHQQRRMWTRSVPAGDVGWKLTKANGKMSDWRAPVGRSCFLTLLPL